MPESEFKLRQYSQKLMARNHSLTFKIGQDSRYTFNTAAHRTKNAAQRFFIKFEYAQSYNSTSEVMVFKMLPEGTLAEVIENAL